MSFNSLLNTSRGMSYD